MKQYLISRSRRLLEQNRELLVEMQQNRDNARSLVDGAIAAKTESTARIQLAAAEKLLAKNRGLGLQVWMQLKLIDLYIWIIG